MRDEVGRGKSLPGKATFEQKEVQGRAVRRSGGRSTVERRIGKHRGLRWEVTDSDQGSARIPAWLEHSVAVGKMNDVICRFIKITLTAVM